MSKQTQNEQKEGSAVDESIIFTDEIDKNIDFGLLIRGIVISRSRKLFEPKNNYRYTYILKTNTGTLIFYVWGEHELFSIGDLVTVPVRISCYLTKNGEIRYSIEMLNNDNSEETF